MCLLSQNSRYSDLRLVGTRTVSTMKINRFSVNSFHKQITTLEVTMSVKFFIANGQKKDAVSTEYCPYKLQIRQNTAEYIHANSCCANRSQRPHGNLISTEIDKTTVLNACNTKTIFTDDKFMDTHYLTVLNMVCINKLE